MSTGEAAASLGVSPNRIRQLVSSGQLPGSRIGRDWVIKGADVERYRTLPAGVKGRPRAVRAARNRAVTPPS
ncbi:MAG TPA: helix-turn-helix domain-containing protein [Vicinamibacteria bacterium]